jgi:hypothetical protein
MADWKTLLRQTQAEKGGVGLSALQRAKDMGASLADLNKFLGSSSIKLGEAAQQSKFAPVSGAKQALNQAKSGGITKTELEQIARKTGTSTNTLIKRIDEMNKAGQDVRLNSGAANMLIKQAQATPSIFGQQPSFGTGNIGRVLTSMMGTPGYPGAMIKGQLVGAREAVPAQLMIGGTQLRPGGRTAVRPMGAAPAVGDTAADTTAAATQAPASYDDYGYDDYGYGDGFDMSYLDSLLADMQMGYQNDMSALTNMFNQQFEQLSSQFDTMNPLQLAQLGITTNPNAIRAPRRTPKSISDYRRISNVLAGVTPALASMGIGGGVTL